MKPGYLIAFIVLIMVAGGGWYYVYSHKPASAGINPSASLYAYVNASGDTVLVDSPRPGAVVGKSFSVMGRARGSWFFEASFPVEVLDQSGNVVASAPATTTAPWMTNDLIPFRANLMVPASYIGPATILLKKDNPSGQSENDASVSYPVTVRY
jgi:hypothetical protein